MKLKKDEFFENTSDDVLDPSLPESHKHFISENDFDVKYTDIENISCTDAEPSHIVDTDKLESM